MGKLNNEYNSDHKSSFLNVKEKLNWRSSLSREQSFSLPLELLEKSEVLMYVRILENVVDRLQWKSGKAKSSPQYPVKAKDVKTEDSQVTEENSPWLKVIRKQPSRKRITRKQLTCKFFLAGYCKFGKYCWYSHDGEINALEEAQRVTEIVKANRQVKVGKYTCLKKSASDSEISRTDRRWNKPSKCPHAKQSKLEGNQIQPVEAIAASKPSSNGKNLDVDDLEKNEDPGLKQNQVEKDPIVTSNESVESDGKKVNQSSEIPKENSSTKKKSQEKVVTNSAEKTKEHQADESKDVMSDKEAEVFVDKLLMKINAAQLPERKEKNQSFQRKKGKKKSCKNQWKQRDV